MGIAPGLLPAWKQQPGMLGVRLGLLNDPKVLTDGSADWFWPAAEKAGIPVMLQAPETGPLLSRIAERHPQLVLIIDHMGLSVPVVKAGRRAAAVDHVLSLAKYPNCSVKLSGAPSYSFERYPWRDVDPEIRRLFDAYGPRRCYWGSDPTNSWGVATYPERVTHLEHLDFMSASDRDWIMGRAILERLKWT
jgi:predicted TIM-barrel fold metal-dependent hydrolase